MAPSLSDLIPQQEPERIATGFEFTEGPVWHPEGYLLFSDIPADTIYRWSPSKGVEPYIRPSRSSNGLTFDRQGRLVACEHGGRQVSRMADGVPAGADGGGRAAQRRGAQRLRAGRHGSLAGAGGLHGSRWLADGAIAPLTTPVSFRLRPLCPDPNS